MEKKHILFEGKIDGTHSQIYFDEEKQQWVLMQHIKDSERNNAVRQIVRYNKGKRDEEKLDIVAKMYRGRRSDFLVGRISEKKAYLYAQQNKQRQIQTESMIKDISKYSMQNNGYVNKKTKLMSQLKEELFNTAVGKKVLAGVLAGTLIIGGTVFALEEMANESSIPDLTNPTISSTVTMPTEPSDVTEPSEPSYEYNEVVELEDVVLEDNNQGALTSDSVKNLTAGIEHEIAELYGLTDWSKPEVVDSKLLTSLFYFENSCKREDSSDAYVGIGQMGKIAVKSAIIRADKIQSQALKKGDISNEDNYILSNICSNGKDIDARTLELWEQSKTDPKMCGTLTGLYLADLSDRYEKTVAGNKAAVIMMYNAGEGNLQKYIKLGIVCLNNGEMTINLSNVHKLTGADRSKYNEAENYTIKNLATYAELCNNPNGDIHEICERMRIAIGKNNNYSQELNTNQYGFQVEGLTFIGQLNQDLGVQPGE